MINNVTAECADTETLVERLLWRAKHQPHRHAYTFLRQGEVEEARLTYAELDRQARAIGAVLQSRGATGKPVLLLHSPSIHYITAFFGCMYAGAIAVPAYPPHSVRMLPRIQAILASTRSNFLATTSEALPALRSNFEMNSDLHDLEWIATDSIAPALADEWCIPSIDRDTIAFLQYTSGSTSIPKGVMVSHSNLQHNLEMLTRHSKQTADSHMVSWVPPYHDLGLICGILYPFYVGYPSTLMSPMAFLQRPVRWLRVISRVRATISMAPNFAYDLCTRKVTPEQKANLDLSSWEVAANGGEPPRYQTMTRFAETFAPCGYRWETFFPGYGMAESTLIIATSTAHLAPVTIAFDKAALEQNRAVPAALKAENVSHITGYDLIAPDQTIRIVEPESKRLCPDGTVGEIWVRGPSITRGYWQAPEETYLAYRAYVAETGEGPFLRTGDLGFFHRESLFVTGRLKDLIIINGHNHYPQDIEATVGGSHPAIRQGCCVAFSLDENGEEQLVVLAEIEPRYRPPSQTVPSEQSEEIRKPLDPEIVTRAIRQAIAEAHNLQAHKIVLLKAGGVLKTSSGKLQRRACRAALLSGDLNIWDEE